MSADGREGANELEEGDVAGQPDVFTRPEVLRDFSSGGYYAKKGGRGFMSERVYEGRGVRGGGCVKGG